MALGKTRLDTRRFGSAENKLDVMAYATSGWTLAVLTNRAIGSFRKLLTRCFAGIAKRQNATYIWQMFRRTIKSTCLYSRGEQLLGIVDGLPVVGHFKSLSRRHRSSSFALMAINSA